MESGISSFSFSLAYFTGSSFTDSVALNELKGQKIGWLYCAGRIVSLIRQRECFVRFIQ